ncbi:beta-propeller fold lactonase family protein [Streptomyces sp. NPDC047022]|uniref:beta-propeller fold lactonase family protein n=1 Tax=Streptomyces sp. NPDC047022 TaxID=3155737 RepID=UPI0033E3CA26
MRLVMTVLAMLAGLSLPVLAAVPARAAAPTTDAYVANFRSGTVSVIDTTTNAVTTTITVGTQPTGVAITPDGTHAYVTDLGSGTVSVIDTTTNTVTTTITVGSGPVRVAITPDGARAYVTHLSTGTVSVIDTTTNTVTATITVGTQPTGVAIGTPPFPSLTVTKTHRGAFVQGEKNAYRITVTNNGTGATDGTTVTVTDTLPTGLTATSLSGTGWACTLATLTCTRNDTLAPAGSYPKIKLTVKASCRAPKQVTNTVTVTGGGSTPDTTTATDPTTIKRDGHCEKRHHHNGKHDKKHRRDKPEKPRKPGHQ